jgi:hypothetical protein
MTLVRRLVEVNAEKTKYKLQSPHQNAGKSHNTKIAIMFFENVAHFKYLGTAVANQNLIFPGKLSGD